MRVRDAIPEDITSMIALEKESPSAAHWSDRSYNQLFEQGIAVRIALVTDDGGRIQGFLVARVASEECELENIVVARGNQRRGVGSELMQALIAAARNRGAARIFLEVRESNLAARSLYEKCGFTITGRRRSYYAYPVEDAVLYTLALV